MTHPRSKNKLALFLIATAIVMLSLYLLYGFTDTLMNYLRSHMTDRASPESIVKVLKLILLASGAYLVVRALRVLLFDLIFRLRRGYEAPTLPRNIFSIAAFTIFFLIIFTQLYPQVNLGALFTTSAI